MTANNSTERLPPISRDALDDHGKALFDSFVAEYSELGFRIANENGEFIGIFRVELSAPALSEAIGQVALKWMALDLWTRRMQEITVLGTAAAEQSDYIWYGHEAHANGVLTPGELHALRRREHVQFSDPKEQVVHDLMRALNDKGDIDDVLYQRAADVLGHKGLTELIWVVGVYKTEALQLRVHRLGTPEDVAPPFPA